MKTDYIVLVDLGILPPNEQLKKNNLVLYVKYESHFKPLFNSGFLWIHPDVSHSIVLYLHS